MNDAEHAGARPDAIAPPAPPVESVLSATDPQDLLRRRTFALWGTGAFAGASVLLALVTLAVEGAATSPAVTAVFWALVLLRIAAGVAGWITLARWMSGVRGAYVAAGAPAPAAWKVWASWFVPIYGLWGPFTAMKGLTSHVLMIESARFRWWWGFVFSWVVAFQTSLNDSLAWNRAGALIAAGLLAVSFVMLRTVIDRATKPLVRG